MFFGGEIVSLDSFQNVFQFEKGDLLSLLFVQCVVYWKDKSVVCLLANGGTEVIPKTSQSKQSGFCVFHPDTCEPFFWKMVCLLCFS